MNSATSPPTSLNSPASLSISGPLPDFVNLDEKYICPVCDGVLRQPMQTSCGHRLCEECFQIQVKKKGEPLLCPVQDDTCERVSRDDGTVMADFCARRELKLLLVYCLYKLYGCKDVLKWMHLEAHVKVCSYAMVACPYTASGCSKLVLRSELDTHMDKLCEYRPVSCPLCKEKLLSKNLKAHQISDCPESEEPCPYNCGEQALLRHEVESHKLLCPAKPKQCNFSDFGCIHQGDDSTIKLHTKEAVEDHLNLVLVRLAEMDVKRTELKTQLHEMRYERDMLKSQVHTLQTDVTNLKAYVEQKDKMLTDLQRMVATQSEKLKATAKTQETIAQKVNTVDEFQEKIIQMEHKLSVAESTGTSKQSPPNPNIDREVSILNLRLVELDHKLDDMQTISYDGSLLWKIANYTMNKDDAQSGRTLSLCSQPFYSSRYGYKMCARIYLNGDGMGRGTHVSLFFVLLRGEYDALLPWPFKQKVTLMLLDQKRSRRHLTDMFRPDPVSSSFQRPQTDMNVASGCPMFVSHSILETIDSPYIVDDTIYIKVVVDTSDLYGP